MRVKAALIAACLLVVVGSLVARSLLIEDASPPESPPVYRRIVSLAPSVTETLFALGLGDRVVGVSRYCQYPPQVADLPKVGGMLDPNVEAIVTLEPDLVVMLVEHERSVPALKQLRLRSLVVNHQSVEGLFQSITTIGRECGAEQAAERLTADLRRRMQRIAGKTAGRPRPRVLCAIDRTLGQRKIEDVYVAGNDGHIDRLLTMAGGQNAYQGPEMPFPLVSMEGILKMDPEVILDLSAGLAAPEMPDAQVLADWRMLADVDAVRHGRVYCLREHYITVPGPRFILVLERFARLLHPELDWESSEEPADLPSRPGNVISGNADDPERHECP